MNGFTNTILSLILGWLRMLISNLWKLLTSPDGGTLYDFLCGHWKAIVLILCAGGFVVDRVIYFLRWRPDYVWASRRAHRRAKRAERRGETLDAPQDEPDDPFQDEPYQQPRADEPLMAEPTTRLNAVPQSTRVARPIAAARQPASVGVFAPPAQANASAVPLAPPPYRAPGAPALAYGSSFSQATANFAPIARAVPTGRAPTFQPYQPPQNLEPVFDDEPPAWTPSDNVARPGPGLHSNPARGMVNSFGNAMPEPVDYLRDMQAGFAPQLPPERIYRSGDPADRFAPARPPIHPGLQSEAFRQSFGLNDEPGPQQAWGDEAFDETYEEPNEPEARPAMFTPFSQTAADMSAAKARPNPFAALAKRARDLVGVEDEDHRPTIRDLQPTVDLRAAFHDPVYPQHKNGDQGGES